MSGICGICDAGANSAERPVEAMVQCLTGPDDTGAHTLAGASSIFGVSSRWPAQQVGCIPGILLAVDADLCDAGELRQSCAEARIPESGLTFAQRLAHLYRVRGAGFVESLQGVFSIAIWEDAPRRLTLIADRLGIQTLYWRQEKDRLLFASRVQAICRAQRPSPEFHPQALVSCLIRQSIAAPLSIFRGTQRLCPGFLLVYESGKLRQERYWDVEYRESGNQNVSHWASRVREEMQASVNRALADCEPTSTGVFLSGGMDSSSVASFAAARLASLLSFSIAFEEQAFDERCYARLIAERFHSRHHELLLTPKRAMDVMEKLTGESDEPLANDSVLAAYWCACCARETGVDTLLAGDGGDEIFGGNSHYVQDRYFQIYQALPGWFRKRVVEPSVRLLPENSSRLSIPRRYVNRAILPNPQRTLSYNPFLSFPATTILEPEILWQCPAKTWLNAEEAHYWAPQKTGILNRQLYMDIKRTLGDNDLRKVVGAAEMAGVRSRFPLLDHRLVHFASQIPSRLKVLRFQSRYIQRRAMRGVLPELTLLKRKHGFGVPVAIWISQVPRWRALVGDLLSDRQGRQIQWVRPEFLKFLFDAVRNRERGWEDYGRALWQWTFLEVWCRRHATLGSAPVPALPRRDEGSCLSSSGSL